ncbi:hypothetical protein RJ640_015458 [Escallonia rubra]|uniref:Uncharacterized protein n=1 Tax=Escallonia rubra TaxID=112253 RepID=A0AA88QV69_9ASTE|nr:hypothetical protein RJ640_015458 [Escallonia rubra]
MGDSSCIAAPSTNRAKVHGNSILFRLQGKVAIVTGGASGIGESTTHLFWKNGAKVVIADVQDELGQAISDKLGENVCYIHCDVSNEEEVINLVDTTVANFGHLDIMFNNAGIVDRPFGSILDTTKSDLERVLRVNVIGSFLGAKHAARVMVPERRGCILFTASACASIAGLASHSYVVSKHGVVGLSKNLAAELGQYGVRVNCISPSGLVTGLSLSAGQGATPEQIEAGLHELGNLKGKFLRVEDVAKAVLYLASDDGGYVSGHNLVLDGGISVVNPSILKAVGLIQ